MTGWPGPMPPGPPPGPNPPGAPRPAGFTSRYDHWGYAEPSVLPKTDRVLAGLLDMRLPLTFSLEDCARIARIVRAEIALLQPGNRTAASQGAA